MGASPKPLMKVGRRILEDPDAPPVAVYLSALDLFQDDDFINWAFEALWMELKDEGIEMPEENKDKLRAISTVFKGDAFYWDATLFENIVMAFNNLTAAVDRVQGATPGQISLGILHSTMIHRGFHGAETPQVYDNEPLSYMAVSCHAEGFVVAPEMLSSCQVRLDQHNGFPNDMKAGVIERWEAVDKTDIDNIELTESPEDVQVAKLAAVYLALHDEVERTEQALDDLGR